ncbi:eIF3 subunit 6 N terminal domain-containing protein [Gilbertella persicaria]|uniref:Eukaryotic translation initiation factor 3 subunit E n=1 Tax=Rhizopus stolonifer TaxID=4846 RepID=A0A367KLI1_RHIST|nr:eIF3 subunit 6 N terminal domain-containing protein [Gilbertella persicaria]KAI8049129.1 eIF3 subunit 6 N terminal domain-containing protein [Gilbertella persicaria]RCI03056.1 eukaryotic translation initiation factor 3 subunit E [Rhizopus stolonifer]
MAATQDLTMRMIPFLDRHLVFPLLEFLELKEVYVPQDLLQAKYDLFKNSNMVDFVLDLYKKLHKTEEAPKEFTEKREKVLSQMEELRTKAQKVMDVLEKPEVIAALRQDKAQNLQYLKDNYKFTDDSINILYEFGQFQYNCGDYGCAADYLYHYRVLSTDAERSLSATWGKMAAEILTGSWDAALEEMQKLREAIDQKNFTSPLQQLQQRTWLLHWSLFIFFNHPKGRDGIVDMFLTPQYINTIQTSCPWILRYLATAVVTNKRRKNQMKELVKIIEQEVYEYQDPVTEFVEALFVRFDFEGAQKKLKECEDVLSNDFFLAATHEDFMESARQFISETYCRIHQKIDIEQMSQRLNLTQEEGEKWIVNLIRDTRVDAKIDFEENTVIMNTPITSVYQQVIERTKGLSFRSQVLATTIKRRELQQNTSNEVVA